MQFCTSKITILTIISVALVSACTSTDGKTDPQELREIAQRMNLSPLMISEAHSPELFDLGQSLFFDPILSGNRNISCATCHHPSASTGDGLPVSIGTGGKGLSVQRELGSDRKFIARNSPGLFNIGDPKWHSLFWDGRVEFNYPQGIKSPAGNDLPKSVPNVLVAQSMFPVTSRDEMLGFKDEYSVNPGGNDISELDDEELIWEALIDRVLTIPEYQILFSKAFPEVRRENFTFVHAGIALAAFQSDAFAFSNSPFDQFVAGDNSSLSDNQLKGFSLFVGNAKCTSCHSGNLFTDQEFHNIASPQTGPGQGLASPDDYGRFTVTQDFDDLYAFRTPPLRNVELTGPWFHSGAFNSLEEVVKHHIAPLESLEKYPKSNSGVNLPSTYTNSWSSRQFSRSAVDETGASLAGFYTHIFSEQERIDRVKTTLDNSLQNLPTLTEQEIDSIVDFLISLTDPDARDLSGLIPETVPSGLMVE